jgi:Spy/CpxP family protein refolding chaperone
MTITDRNETAAPAKNEMSPKTRTTIAVTALLACLLIGGGIVYWLLFGASPKRRVVTVDPKEQAAANRTPVMNVRQQRRDAPGIMKVDEEWVVRSTSGEMRLRDKAASAADPVYRFPDGLKLPPEQVSLLAGRFRVLHDEAMAQEWKVTPQQLEKLRNLQIGGSQMSPSPQQRDELFKLWTQYNGATGGQAKIDAQKKLIDKLEETAKSLFDPARQQYTAKLEEIKKILTPEQVQMITKR